MRKKIYFLLFVMMISFGVSAQHFEYQLGMKGGLGIDWIGKIDDEAVGKDNGFCYKFGMTGVYYFKESYGITSGFNIIGGNFAYNNNVVDDSGEKKMEYSFVNTYVQIPVLLKMRTDTFAKKYRIFGEIGYGFDIFVDGECKINGEKAKSPYRDVCSSFILHIGFEMDVLNRSTLQFAIAYDDIFSNMQKLGYNKLTMNSLCLEVGFLF